MMAQRVGAHQRIDVSHFSRASAFENPAYSNKCGRRAHVSSRVCAVSLCVAKGISRQGATLGGSSLTSSAPIYPIKPYWVADRRSIEMLSFGAGETIQAL